jgi:hypothetical protein
LISLRLAAGSEELRFVARVRTATVVAVVANVRAPEEPDATCWLAGDGCVHCINP